MRQKIFDHLVPGRCTILVFIHTSKPVTIVITKVTLHGSKHAILCPAITSYIDRTPFLLLALLVCIFPDNFERCKQFSTGSEYCKVEVHTDNAVVYHAKERRESAKLR